MLFEVQHNAVVAVDAAVDAVVDAVNVGWVQWLFSYGSALNVFKSDISFLMNINKLFVHFQYETKKIRGFLIDFIEYLWTKIETIKNFLMSNSLNICK